MLVYLYNKMSFAHLHLPTCTCDLHFQAIYGTDSYVPKHHFSVHLPSLMELHGMLISCFVHERRHKITKRSLDICFGCSELGASFTMFHTHWFMVLEEYKIIAKTVFDFVPWFVFLWLPRFANMQHSGHESMDRSVLREVVTTHIFDLQTDEDDSAWKPAKPNLVEAWKNHLGLPFLTHALLVAATSNRCHMDDMVAVTEPRCIAQVLFHIRYGETRVTLVKCFEKTGKNTFKMNPHDNELFVSTSCLQGAVVYKRLDAESILVAPQSFYTA